MLKLPPSLAKGLQWILGRLLSNPRAVHWLYRLAGVGPLAHLLSWTIVPGPRRREAPAVLCVSRLLFDKDIEQLRLRTQRLNWPTLRTNLLGLVQRAWTPEELREQTRYFESSRADRDAAWKESEKFGLTLLALAKKRYGVAAVMSANIDYWQDEGLRRACRHLGIPFLVLSKEHQTIPVTFPRTVEHYRSLNFRYTGTAAAVFGASTKDLLLESGACAADQIWVTGPPRLDQWRDLDQTTVTKDTLTLLSYADPSYMAPRSFSDVLALFADAAARHRESGMRFVVKCKNPHDRDHIMALLEKHRGHQLELAVEMPLFDLLPRSRLVIGYNSLAMLEALFSNAVLAVPQWGDARRDPAEQNIDPTDPECLVVYDLVESPEDLCRVIDEAVRPFDFVPDRAKRFRLLNKYFHTSRDETSSLLVEHFALNFISDDDLGEAARPILPSLRSA